MSTLVLRYAAPLASFGHTSRFDTRATAATPTLSAIQGMVAAAAGAGRDRPWPAWIADLHVAIRTEHPGTPLSDYHTINQPPLKSYRDIPTKDRNKIKILANAEQGRASFNTLVTRRHYIADSTFLLTIDDPTGNVTDVLTAPRWAISAGRKTCTLTAPFLLGHHPDSPENAAAAVPTVTHPTERDLDGTATRALARFSAPDSSAPNGGHEDRNDRAAGFRNHRVQRRWHTRVTVPVTTDWFAVIDELAPTGPAT